MKSYRQQLRLKFYPDSALRQVCEPVDKFDEELRVLIEEMLFLMRTHNGIGLAAPQVGITKRLLVCELEGHTVSLTNPEIIDVNGQEEMIEGCLSLPEVHVNVTRSEQLHVHGYDSKGQGIQFKMTGLWARVIQHEMDHLDGVLICDHGENLQIDPQLNGDS
jgi:peptide deformylase